MREARVSGIGTLASAPWGPFAKSHQQRESTGPPGTDGSKTEDSDELRGPSMADQCPGFGRGFVGCSTDMRVERPQPSCRVGWRH